MSMFHCDMCWDNPCTCGHEARRIEKFRTEFYASYGRKPPEVEAAERKAVGLPNPTPWHFPPVERNWK